MDFINKSFKPEKKMQWGIQLKAPSHVIWVSDLQNSKANQPKSYVMNYNKSYHKKREAIIYQYREKTGAQKRKLAALKKEKEAENQSSLSRWIKKQKPSPCEPVQRVTVPQIEYAGNETPRGTATSVEGLLEPQFRLNTPQDKDYRWSSDPTDISLSSLDLPSQPKLVQ
ncbi:hypothetical protein QYM36_004045 [Artemia franciscana]|uniref:Uncharacterized protein n=1 Tax=Artemia franciscana TaxID=6661 RepID=A0AA88I2R3_ARTSF|nr:hypothetical protein QYM36_004045 [Artemia franciscana]